ncbi:MAG: hypothetical protein GXY44_11240 [Phycisphaerales bacterium]|nr:hypothetical protein [Phycisphaerales bacterium]
MGSDQTSANIARHLGISVPTVRLHVKNIHGKLGSVSKVDLVLKMWQWANTNVRDAGDASLL